MRDLEMRELRRFVRAYNAYTNKREYKLLVRSSTYKGYEVLFLCHVMGVLLECCNRIGILGFLCSFLDCIPCKVKTLWATSVTHISKNHLIPNLGFGSNSECPGTWRKMSLCHLTSTTSGSRMCIRSSLRR
jgi:hypothetical protein